jgi:hypothetical protein
MLGLPVGGPDGLKEIDCCRKLHPKQMAYRLLDNGLVLLGIPCSSLLSGSTGAGHLREPSRRLRLLDPLSGLDLDLLWHFLGLGLEMVNHSGQGILEVQHALLDGLELRVLGDGLVDVYISNSFSVPSSKEMA